MSQPKIHSDFYQDIHRTNQIRARIDPLEEIQPMYSASHSSPEQEKRLNLPPVPPNTTSAPQQPSTQI